MALIESSRQIEGNAAAPGTGHCFWISGQTVRRIFYTPLTSNKLKHPIMMVSISPGHSGQLVHHLNLATQYQQSETSNNANQ